MKIKNDFVTNSSSCSYVFCFPKNFNIREYITQKLGPEDVEDEELLSAIDELIESNQLIQYDNYSTYSNMVELLKDFQIAAFDSAPDTGEIQILYLEDIVNKVKGMFKYKVGESYGF